METSWNKYTVNVQDMKRKLRKQYVELGGSANTV